LLLIFVLAYRTVKKINREKIMLTKKRMNEIENRLLTMFEVSPFKMGNIKTNSE